MTQPDMPAGYAPPPMDPEVKPCSGGPSCPYDAATPKHPHTMWAHDEPHRRYSNGALLPLSIRPGLLPTPADPSTGCDDCHRVWPHRCMDHSDLKPQTSRDIHNAQMPQPDKRPTRHTHDGSGGTYYCYGKQGCPDNAKHDPANHVHEGPGYKISCDGGKDCPDQTSATQPKTPLSEPRPLGDQLSSFQSNLQACLQPGGSMVTISPEVATFLLELFVVGDAVATIAGHAPSMFGSGHLAAAARSILKGHGR